MSSTPLPTNAAQTAAAIAARPDLQKFLSRVDPVRGQLIFALDATASRQPTWDLAAHLQGTMFETVAAAGGLDVQIVYYRGSECVASRWFSDPRSLSAVMRRVTCAAGITQIKKVLLHARKEHARQKVNALIFVGDAVEELPIELYSQARELGDLKCFLFQEGADPHVSEVFAELARLTGGASCKFDTGAAQQLSDLLKAVAAFAVGGAKLLASQKNEAATLLLTQMKKSGH
jgi:hypothetical protein